MKFNLVRNAFRRGQIRPSASLIAAAALLVSATANASPVFIGGDPFAGSTALTTPGRQVFGGKEQQLPSFDPVTDKFVIDLAAFKPFGVTGLKFLNAPSSGIPGSGFNVVVLQDTDNDANPSTPFGAGNAASLIASRIDTDGAGFFIYKNSVLDVDRLVFSTNLNDASADLSVMARITSPRGQAATDALLRFNAGNFEVASIPEPSSFALLGAGLAAVGFSRKRRARR